VMVIGGDSVSSVSSISLLSASRSLRFIFSGPRVSIPNLTYLSTRVTALGVL